jgi:hypothetical protein
MMDPLCPPVRFGEAFGRGGVTNTTAWASAKNGKYERVFNIIVHALIIYPHIFPRTDPETGAYYAVALGSAISAIAPRPFRERCSPALMPAGLHLQVIVSRRSDFAAALLFQFRRTHHHAIDGV